MKPVKTRQSRLHYRTFGFEIRAIDEKDGSYFEGYCAVHNNIDEYGTIMGRGCFDADIAHFRDNGFIGGLNHDWNNPLGTPNAKTRADDHGLYVGANVLDTTHGQDVRKLLKAGVCKKLSFGFEDLDRRWLDQREDVERYWDSVGYQPDEQDKERCKNGALLFTRLRVHEASPVMGAGNTKADITEVRYLRYDDGNLGDDGAMSIECKGGRWYCKANGKMEPEDGFETKQEAEALMSACTKPRAFLDFQTHALAVRDAVKEFCGRAEQLSALRAAEGRSIAPERRAILRQIRDDADRALAACQPRVTRESVAAIRRELLQLEQSVLTP